MLLVESNLILKAKGGYIMVKIAIDCGHGLKTPGKQTPDGIREWTLNDKVRDKAVSMLKDYDCEIIFTDNNEGNVDESLASRLNKYKSAGASAFVSIHHNAYTGKWGNATGVEVYTDRKPTAKDKELANAIYNRLVKYTGLRGRGVKKANFYVINQNTIPAVLVEGGFMDGRNDYKVITSESGQEAYAKAVAEGLVEFLNLKKKASTSTPSKTVDEIAKEVIAGKWGNGQDRKDRLTKAGYDYTAIQNRVNALLGKTETKKSIDEIAREVIAGKWGNGSDRKKRLKAAGYDYKAVQKRVNELL